MKALELTVYPPFAHDWSIDKRLTDAELAAEYHAQAVRVRRIEDGRPHRVAGPSAYRKLEALHRFATLPHYDEKEMNA